MHFMRMIGYLASEGDARLFGDYLYARGIKNDVEVEKDGTWMIWVHGEDELEPAKELLDKYRSNPRDPEYRQVAQSATELRQLEESREAAAAKRMFDSRRVFRRERFGMGPLTLALVVISAAIYIFRESGNRDFWNFLFISVYDPGSFAQRIEYGLQEVRQFQIWRLATPIFLHFGILHILFNMLWLRDLGSMVESRQGSKFLALLIVVIAVTSNVAQYYIAGPGFGGMSGVIYGLLGYIWMKTIFDPSSGYFLHESTVVMMLIWFVICFLGILPVGIANTVHAVGLGLGVAWGYLAAKRSAT